MVRELRKSVCLLAAFLGALMLALMGCSQFEPERPIEYYYPATRQTPPQPVYNRLTWSYLPSPEVPRSNEHSPELTPKLNFDMPHTTLGEAVEALGQTVGYRWSYPQVLASRPVSIRKEATPERILAEIGQQGGVVAVFDHDSRRIVIDEGAPEPDLDVVP